jgi:hypothetical protein
MLDVSGTGIVAELVDQGVGPHRELDDVGYSHFVGAGCGEVPVDPIRCRRL